MPAIHPNSTTLGNIPADIDASSSLPTSNAAAVIDDGSIDMPSIMDNITIYDESTDITQEVPIILAPSPDEPEISSIEVIVANNTLPTASDTFIADASLTDAPFLSNTTDFSGGMRAGRNLDFFPNKLASIIKNDPIAYIERYKLSINQFADEMVNHQQQYGLSECLFEPLHKIGEAFAIVYSQNPQKQDLVKRYLQYISDLRNSSDSSPVNCSDTTHWSIPTTTTPLSSTEPTLPTTEQVTTPENTTVSPDFTTDTLQSPNSTTLRPNLNTTQNSSQDQTVPTGFLNSKLFSLGWVSAAHGLTAGVVHGVTGSIYNKFESSGYLNGWRKPVAKVGVTLVNTTVLASLPMMLSTVDDNDSEHTDFLTKVLHATAYTFGGSLILNGVNYAAHWNYEYFNKKPMHKESIGSKALEALPLLANTSLLINDGYNLNQAAVIVGANTLSAGLSSAVTQTIANRIFNKTKKNNQTDVETGSNNNIPMVPFKNTVASKTPETNTFAFEGQNFNLDNQFQKLATEAFNTKSSSRLDELLKALDKLKFFENKDDIKTQAFFLKNLILLAMQNPEIGLHAYNLLQSQERLLPTSKNLEENCSIIPFTLNENGNFQPHDDNKSIFDANTTILKELLGSFISGLKLNTKDFKFESKIFKAENKYSFDRLNISHGVEEVLSIFSPADIKQDAINTQRLFDAINLLLDKLSKNKSNITFKFLFILPGKSTTAVIEIVTYPSSSLQKDKISIYNPDNLLKNKLKELTNNAIKSGYVNTNPGIKFSQAKFKHDPFSVYSFIKNSVKNYLETCLSPNNASPDLLEGLLATFIYKLQLTDLNFETEKVHPSENNQESALAKKHLVPKNTKETEEIKDKIDLKNGYLVNTIDRKRNNAIAACQTTSKNNNILSIFKSIPPNSSLVRKLPREEVLKHLLHKRKSEIKAYEIRRDLLPFADEKGMAIVEITTSKSSESKLIIHDLLGLLADIHTKIVAIAKENGYQYGYNPNKDYSPDWQSKERCQLAAYYFIKKAALSHLEHSEQMNAKFINNNNINLPSDILDEVKHNLSINNEYDVDCLHEIKRCDGGVFNLRTYITDVSNYLKILSIETAPLTNKSDLPQALTTEIQLNLGLADRHSNLLANSTQEIITWNSVRFDNWPALFSTEVTLSQTETGKVYYFVKFPSDFMFASGKMAVLSKRENSESEHALLSDLRNLLVYNSSDKDIKIVKQKLWLHSLQELFSKFHAKESTHHETKVFTHRAGFFNAVPNSPAVAPDLLNHLTPGYK